MIKKFIILFIILSNCIFAVAQCPQTGLIGSQSQIDAFPSEFPDCINMFTKLEVRTNLGLNDPILNLDSLSQLESCTSLLIYSNAELSSIKGLANLNSLYQTDNHVGALLIENNPKLESLEGLENITKVKTTFNIRNSPLVKDLMPLKNIVIFEDIQIGLAIQETGITSLAGIGQIHIPTEDQKKLNTSFNPYLSVCNVQSMCDYVSDPPLGSETIQQNAEGCNTYAEILESCDVLNNIDVNINEQITIYPNPAYDDLHIDAEDPVSFIIVNQVGKIEWLQNTPQISHTLTVSAFPAGIYYVKISSDSGAVYRKIIVTD